MVPALLTYWSRNSIDACLTYLIKLKLATLEKKSWFSKSNHV